MYSYGLVLRRRQEQGIAFLSHAFAKGASNYTPIKKPSSGELDGFFVCTIRFEYSLVPDKAHDLLAVGSCVLHDKKPCRQLTDIKVQDRCIGTSCHLS